MRPDPRPPRRARSHRLLAAFAVSAVAVVGAATFTATASAADAPDPAPIAGTPCTETARACVDLASKQAWLIHDGTVSRGPVPISHGGQDTATPTGTFAVEWKNKNHRSKEFNDAPMPYAVFFAPGGIAFHEGSLATTSAGCVRLAREEAAAFYDDLQVGDEVQVR